MVLSWRGLKLWSLGGLLAGVVGCGGPGATTVDVPAGEATVSAHTSVDPARSISANGEAKAAAIAAALGCTYTQGYWKNHPAAWPVSSLALGTTTYTQAQLLAIFNKPVGGNGLISLAHQLIAAKLNIAQGAAGAALGTSIADADALIGGLVVPPVGSGSLSTSSTSSLVSSLTSFNEGQIGPGHCGNTPPPPPPPVCGDGKVDTNEACDDGNTVNGDGCSSTCTVEPPPPPPPPVCGDGKVDTNEACDDGNTMNGDGCSSTCTIEPPPPPPEPCCGNGIVEAGETCDDGNTSNWDGCSSTCQLECIGPVL